MLDGDDKVMNDKPEGRTLATADIQQIMTLLPHRYPFLLVDKIIDIDRDESAIGIKNVTINENFFQGHFPKYPVMPGVLIIEALAQTAGAICVHNAGVTDIPQIVQETARKYQYLISQLTIWQKK